MQNIIRLCIQVVLFLLISITTVSAQQADYISSDTYNEQAIKELKQCMKKKIKYPLFMQIFKLEGRVFVLLSIDDKGKVKDIKTEADYFGKVYSIERITNKNRIEKYRLRIEKKLIPLFENCIRNIQFKIPESINESIVRIPVSFGSYDDYDDFGLIGDYDDYDYNEEYDYHYFEYD